MHEQVNDPIKEHQVFHKPPVLKLMVVIVDWHKVDIVKEIMRDFYVRLKYVCVGQGTANSELLDVLGLGHSDKGVMFCLIPEYCVKKMMDTLSDKLWLRQPGKGIAFVLPLSGISSPASHLINDEKYHKLAESLSSEEKEKYIEFHKQAKAEWEAHKMDNVSGEILHDLIVVVVNQGYSDDLMNKAKEAGAGGGTIIPARRIDTEEAVKFFGISVQSEKEIVTILTKREKKNDIMKAIDQSYGLSSDAKGIVFSLPVDGIVGLGNI